MREILFKGKTIAEGKWIEGSLIIDERENYYIGKYIKSRNNYSYYCTNRRNGKTLNRFIGIGFAMVIPSTVGQYTGLTDKNGKNGKKIFEGDIGKGFNSLHPDRTIYQVVYEGNGFYYCDEDEVAWHPDHIDNFEIIGNIHDNPELLKGGAE